jgi:hypothetical protein
MFASVSAARRAPATVFESPDIPAHILRAFADNPILDASGTYGDQRAGDPIQYESLYVVHDGGTTSIEFFNRVIALFLADDELLRRIHRVIYAIDPESHNRNASSS